MTTTTTIPLQFNFTMPTGSPTCCCGVGSCCGRKLPGITAPYQTGAEYYPLIMNCTITAQENCSCPASPLSFELDWQGDEWFRDSVSVGTCPSYNYPITNIWLQCAANGNWRGGFTWGDGCGMVTFDLVASKNAEDECDPFTASTTVEVTNAYCCGFTSPPVPAKSLFIEFYE
jgi:hypothetical protein